MPLSSRLRRGFTLFEVAIALLIAGAVIAAAMAIFPAGIKVQQLARFRLLAALKGYELIQRFNTTGNINHSVDLEAPKPWDVPSSYVNLANDFEAKMSTRGFGILPLPTAIARRLDSDNDEIQRILDSGANLYYCAASSQMEQDAQKLVFAVDGYAQQNAIAQFHRKRWPYYVAYPSPPQVMHHQQQNMTSGGPAFFRMGSDNGTGWGQVYFWEKYTHPEDPSFATDVDKAHYFHDTTTNLDYGAWPYTEASPSTAPADMLAMAERSFQGALWFAKRSGMSVNALESITAPLTDWSQGTCPAWRQVAAMRYLSFAATCLTRWKNDTELTSGYIIPAAVIDGIATPDVEITRAKIDHWHETALNLADLLATSDPYDWGAPRPAERTTMMDLPLLQWDLFTPPATGVIDQMPGAITAAQWKPLSARPVTNAGVSYSYPESPIDPALEFSPATAHFNLTAAFTAAERCRQLVFWSVDWQAYEDFESAPSAAVDASRRPKAAPYPGGGDRMWVDQGGGGQLDWIPPHQVNFGNPEKAISFTAPVNGADLVSGTADDVPNATDLQIGTSPLNPPPALHILGGEIFHSPDCNDWAVFRGDYGADRNGNGRLDRGVVASGVRMRAQAVARINFYDPRLCMVLR